MYITELFSSIQGESSEAGYPVSFIRCAGCNLSCSYCDTPYAHAAGTQYSIDTILTHMRYFNLQRITITGGEPLLQDDISEVCDALLSDGYTVSVETNGTRDISILPKEVHIIMDVKTPGSGESEHHNFKNFSHLRPDMDEIKWVLTSRHDYEWALHLIEKYNLNSYCNLFSPVTDTLEPHMLAQWLVSESRNTIRLQIQLHKYIQML